MHLESTASPALSFCKGVGMDVADSSASSTKVPPSQPKHNLLPSHINTFIHTINECIMSSLPYASMYAHKCRTVEKSPIRRNSTRKIIPRNSLTDTPHMHDDVVSNTVQIWSTVVEQGTRRQMPAFKSCNPLAV